MKTLLTLFILLFSSSVVAEEFKIDDKIIHPLLIDCLYTNMYCEKSPEIIFFSNKAVERSQDDIKIFDDYYQFNIELKKSFNEFYIDEYDQLTENKLPTNSYEFYPSKGHIKYKPLLELKDFAYLPINEELDLSNYKEGFTSHWLLQAESQEKLWCGKGYGECHFAFIVVEIFKSQKETDNNYIRPLKIIPYRWVDIKYGYDIEYVDRNQDGYKDIVFYKLSGGTGTQSYQEEIHFFNQTKTEVFNNKYRTTNTHHITFYPGGSLLDEIDKDLIRNADITWNENIIKEVIFTKDSFPSDNNFSFKETTRTLFIPNGQSEFELSEKIAKIIAEKHSNEFECKIMSVFENSMWEKQTFACEIQTTIEY